MSTALAIDEALAARVATRLPGRIYDFGGADMRGVKPEDWPLEGPAQVVAFVEEHKPEALVLDVRFGGQQYRILEGVQVMLRGSEAMRQPPAVVVLVPNVTMAVARATWTMGCYSMIDISRFGDDEDRLASQVAEEALAAMAWRQGVGVRRLRLECEPTRPPLRARVSVASPLRGKASG